MICFREIDPQIIPFIFFLGQSKNGDQEAEFSTKARENQSHGPLRQDCDRGVQEGQTLQKYPLPRFTTAFLLHFQSVFNLSQPPFLLLSIVCVITP